MTLNWIDGVIIAIFLYGAYQGWLVGFVSLGINYIAFAVSVWLSVFYHQPVADFFTEKFGLSILWSTIFGYVFIIIASQIALMYVLHLLISRIPKKIEDSKINSFFGMVVSALNDLTLIAFVLVIIITLPLRGTIKKDVRNSAIGGNLVTLVEKYGGPVSISLRDFEKKATKFFTIEPNSKELVPLDIAPKAEDLQVDDPDERELLAFVNAERAKVGAPKLTVDVGIVKVARNHSRDMFMRRYFGHITPDGKSPAERFDAGEVKYTFMGENLAYAPDVQTAHQGLMDSPDHKKNILDPAFKRIGIGIVSTESLGIMVTEDFAN